MTIFKDLPLYHNFLESNIEVFPQKKGKHLRRRIEEQLKERKSERDFYEVVEKIRIYFEKNNLNISLVYDPDSKQNQYEFKKNKGTITLKRLDTHSLEHEFTHVIQHVVQKIACSLTPSHCVRYCVNEVVADLIAQKKTNSD